MAFHRCTFERTGISLIPKLNMRKILIVCCLLLSTLTKAQLTEYFTEADRPYKDAWELYIKEKYSAAKDKFNAYLVADKGTAHNKINATFLCFYVKRFEISNIFDMVEGSLTQIRNRRFNSMFFDNFSFSCT